MDVKWSPIHPALFASVDSSGRLDLWNLNQDTEVPSASVTLEGAPALNKVSWTPSGLHVTVGDKTGRIHVYDVAEVSESIQSDYKRYQIVCEAEFCPSETRRMEQISLYHSGIAKQSSR